MNGISGIRPAGVYNNNGDIAYSDIFLNTVIQDSLECQFSAVHPASIDPANTSTWFDLSANKRNATMFNSPQLTDMGWIFNGTNQFASYTWPLSLNTQFFSIEFWVKPDNIADVYAIGNGSNPTTNIRLLNTSGFRYVNFSLSTTSGTMFFQNPTNIIPYVPGGVEHYVCTRENDRLKVAINGKSLPALSESGFYSAPVNVNPSLIGRSLSNYFPGTIYYFAMYSRPLTSEEISFNYNKNKSRYPL